MACPQTSLICPREEQLPKGCCWVEKQFGLAFSQQMLGTIRINGLEIQVGAIQKLPDYSTNHSLRRERLIEAQIWKSGKEAAITLFNPASWGRVSRESSHKSR